MTLHAEHVRAALAKMPIRLEPIRPPATTSAITSRLKTRCSLLEEVVEALVDETDLDLPVAHLLHQVVPLVRRLGDDLRVARSHRAARARATRCGVKRSISSPRAYGRATSKTLKSG